MAFQQRPQPLQRHISIPQVEQTLPKAVQSPRKRTLAESEEWILFSPNADSASRTATSQTARTATHLSDFGSLETHIRSQLARSDRGEVDAPYDDDEDQELDSLDDGLHAFQHHPFSSSSLNQLDQSGGAVLPTHDGLGTFSAGMQNQLWQFEKHNPHRRRGLQRKSSLQQRIDEVEGDLDLDIEDERIARVEKWRIDQSRAVLEEIQRETQRRRRRMSRMSAVTRSVDENSTAPLDDSLENLRRVASNPVPSSSQTTASVPNESWWARITRRVIREIIGIDDTTLSVLFGDNASPTPTQASPIAAAARRESRVTFNDSSSGWELRLLERIARELGILVNTLTHDHEGAFSAYTETSTGTISIPTREVAPRQVSYRQRHRMAAQTSPSNAQDIRFTPSLAPGPASPGTEADTSLWGIEEEPEDDAAAVDQQAQRERWERDIDVSSVFAYLRCRFSTPNPPAQSTPAEETGPLPSAWATDRNTSAASAFGTSPEGLARAESIRRQHPLVHRAAERAAAQHRRRESLLRRHQMAALLQRARGSSCASHSTKRSRHTLSGGSSRHFWDIGAGGSVDSEAAFSAGAGNAGNWGV